MQINVNRAQRPEQKPNQGDLAAQLRAAQQNNVKPTPVQPAVQQPQSQPQPQQNAPKPDPYQERMAKMEAAMLARQAQKAAAQQGGQPRMAEQTSPSPSIQPNPVQPTAAQQRAAQADLSDILAKEAAAVKAAEAAKATEAPVQAAPEAEVKAPVESKSAAALDTRNIQETLKDFIGQAIRILTVDHENSSGRLEVVADGWIKLVNVRSAGTEYYADEDIISIQHIVKVKTARSIDKEYYNQFMNR